MVSCHRRQQQTFHFEVNTSVVKLLGRIVAPDNNMLENLKKTGELVPNQVASSLHDHTYGITSDPLTRFACVISALINEIEHPGVPNTQFVKENEDLAKTYKGKSVAEQNSILKYH
jgi:hypothetical protein